MSAEDQIKKMITDIVHDYDPEYGTSEQCAEEVLLCLRQNRSIAAEFLLNYPPVTS